MNADTGPEAQRARADTRDAVPVPSGAAARTGGAVPDYPKLLERLGRDGLDELRRLIADEIAKRGARRDTPPTTLPNRPGTMPGPDEDLRPRS